MLAEQRRRKILELTQRDGRAAIKDVARRFSASLIAICRDL
jgi:DeoR/GlpR family transcriptional regulator of sugar metabolism